MQILQIAKVVLLTAILGLTACEKNETAETEKVTESTVVGGDRDEHGCIGSAGYQWCSSLQQCIRPWELAKMKNLADDSKETIDSVCDAQKPNEAKLVGSDRDEHGCIGSAGYQWCASIKQCVRPWELAKTQNLVNDSAETIAAFCKVKTQ